jgi:hypothetical protein
MDPFELTEVLRMVPALAGVAEVLGSTLDQSREQVQLPQTEVQHLCLRVAVVAVVAEWLFTIRVQRLSILRM